MDFVDWDDKEDCEVDHITNQYSNEKIKKKFLQKLNKIHYKS